MIRFVKAQASSLVATGVDYSLTILLKEIFGLGVLMASGIGLIAGGITNFCINRDLVFNRGEKEIRFQAARYLLVWSGNFLLNICGVWLLMQIAPFDYKVSKIIVSLIVGWSYNYFLQKYYVFK